MVSTLLVFAVMFVSATIASPTAAAKPEIVWDGRIPKTFDVKSFDDPALSPFNVDWNHGKNQTWSEIIKFPRVPQALLDRKSAKPWAVILTDSSIFIPGDESTRQGGFRRSEVMPSINNGSDATVQGTTTLHFSVMKDASRPLNGTHMYHVTFLETADYASHIWTLNTGTAYGTDAAGRDAKALRLESGTTGGVPAQLLFQTEFRAGVWHNFAVQVDFEENALAAWYSAGNNPLKQVVKRRENDATGKGQYHIGLIKHPTGDTSNVVKQGYQPSGINEGIIFGGVFMEGGNKVTTK